MVTIAFGFIVESVSIEWRDLTGGSSGLAGIPAPFSTGGTALLACGFCVAAFAFSYYLVPETKGQTLEQIAEWWSGKPKRALT